MRVSSSAIGEISLPESVFLLQKQQAASGKKVKTLAVTGFRTVYAKRDEDIFEPLLHVRTFRHELSIIRHGSRNVH